MEILSSNKRLRHRSTPEFRFRDRDRITKKAFHLQEIQQAYPYNKVTESKHGFELEPASPRQGKETLVIPKSLIAYGENYDKIADLTATWKEDVVEELLCCLAVEEYTSLYAAYCRFGKFWHDKATQHNYFLITDPKVATHVQLLGIRDCVGEGWSLPKMPVEERLSAIAADSYDNYLPWTDEILRGWILNTEFRTVALQKECSRKFNLGFPNL